MLALVDVNEPCVIRRLAPATEVRTLPSNDLIAESIGGIAIGTFSKPPAPTGGARAIIDIHADSVWAIVPARLWPDVRAVVESGGKAVRRDKMDERRVEPADAKASAPSRQEPDVAAVERDKPAPSPATESSITDVRADEGTTRQPPSTTDDQTTASHEPPAVERGYCTASNGEQSHP